MSNSLQCLVLTLLAVMLIACGGDSTGSSPEPPTEAAESGSTPAPPARTEVTATVAPTVQGMSVPTPLATTTGTAVPASTLEPEPAPDPTPTQPPARRYILLAETPCIDAFRQDLLGYDGVEEFGPEVAQRLSNQFVERRPDCAELGWNPGFPVEQVGRLHRSAACDTYFRFSHPDSKTGKDPSPPFLVMGNYNNVKGLRPTMLTPAFDLGDGVSGRAIALVHLDPLPADPDGWGCWYGSYRGWYWTEFRSSAGQVEQGFDQPRYPHCEEQLRSFLRENHADGQTLDVDGVASAIQLVSQGSPDD